jgi:methionyl-tRNA formyltransferase
LRIVLMGTGPFAVPAFDAIRAAGHPILLVVTRPLTATKSRSGPPPSPVRLWAAEHQLPLFDPHSINDPASVQRLQSIAPDLLVVCDYGQILKPAALQSATLGGINLHGSLLPKYRGAAPVQWAMLSGDRETGVSVIHMTPRLDGGPILTTRRTPIRGDETAGDLEARLSQIGVEATIAAIELVHRWDGRTTIGDLQDPQLVTLAPRLAKSDGLIDWSRTATEIDCQVRGLQPWPIAFTNLSIAEQPPLRLAIKQVQIQPTAVGEYQAGQVLAGDEFRVATGDHIIHITRLQPAGKKEMQGSDFLRGYPAAIGTILK